MSTQDHVATDSAEVVAVSEEPAGEDPYIAIGVVETVSEPLVVQEASTNLVTIPAVYETVSKRIEVSPARTAIEVLPARYEAYTERVLVKPEQEVWEPVASCVQSADCKVDGATGEYLSRVLIPAEYETVTRQRIVAEEMTREIVIPAQYETVEERVMVEPERIVEVTPPATYQSIERRIETRRPAAVTFHAPSIMVEDDTYFLTALIGLLQANESDAELAERLQEQLADTSIDEVNADDISLEYFSAGSRMEARLRAPGFEIDFDQDLQQQKLDLSDDETIAEWNWMVRPTRSGRLPLTMQVYRIEEVDGEDVRKRVKTFRRRIDVRSASDPFLVASEPSMLGSSVMTPSLSENSLASKAAVLTSDNMCNVSAPAFTNGKVAFIAANAAYASEIGVLEKTLEDGAVMREALSATGFEVMYCENLSHQNTLIALNQFTNRIDELGRSGQEVSAVFYYSGHGLSVGSNGQTYLIPTDMDPVFIQRLDERAINLDLVSTGIASAEPRRLIMIFDACRDTLDIQGFATKGLTRRVWRTGGDLITAYPNSWGKKTADDGVYAKSLASWIQKPHPNVEFVFNAVQNEVWEISKNARFPEYTDQNTGVFAFWTDDAR
ncbi:MAG: hypothetical protein Hens3KO_16950 [Henriciella sp.]